MVVDDETEPRQRPVPCGYVNPSLTHQGNLSGTHFGLDGVTGNLNETHLRRRDHVLKRGSCENLLVTFSDVPSSAPLGAVVPIWRAVALCDRMDSRG